MRDHLATDLRKARQAALDIEKAGAVEPGQVPRVKPAAGQKGRLRLFFVAKVLAENIRASQTKDARRRQRQHLSGFRVDDARGQSRQESADRPRALADLDLR